MKDIIPTLKEWISNETKFAIATVIQTWGSSPRPVGSVLLISEAGEMVGSVSGGCVEIDVLKEVKYVLSQNERKLLGYGVTNEEAWGFGLTCGGKVSVMLEPFYFHDTDHFSGDYMVEIMDGINAGKGFVWIKSMNESNDFFQIFQPDKDSNENEKFSKEFIEPIFKNRLSKIVVENEEEYFFHVVPPKPNLYLIGAAHITVELVEIAKMFDFRVTVIDPRAFFGTNTTFKIHPDEIKIAYPSQVIESTNLGFNDFAVVLSHDPKIDDNALEILLRSEVAYIGALGSRRTHEKRKNRLTEMGFFESDIDRIHAPVGLDIKAKSAKEIALSIMAEIISLKNKESKK